MRSSPFRPLKALNVLWIVGVCALLSTEARSQSQDERRPHFDARAMVGIPTGQTSDYYQSGGGIGGSLMFPIGEGPVQLGADLALMSFNSAPLPGQPTTSTSVLSGHLVFRLQPAFGIVRPYADLFLGSNQAFTEVNGPQGNFNSQDFGLGYGAGVGVDVTLIDRDTDFFLNNLEATGGLRVMGSGLALTEGLPPIGGGAVGSQSAGSWMIVPTLGVMTSF